MQTSKLTRKTENQMVAGVCAGLADYLRIDATIVRLFFFFLLFAEGIGGLLYVILWIVMPSDKAIQGSTLEVRIEQGAEEFSERIQAIGEEIGSGEAGTNHNVGMIVGGGLILVGCYYLLRVLPINLPFWLDASYLWPVFIIAAGVLLLVRRVKEN
ncbi:MAG: PspC domain-containing protein [Anaerolineales bacterium]|nr:PspC domain-containing protein [Anaerolineales bacterium]